MRALSSIPFCPYDGRQAGLLYLPACWRDTTISREGSGRIAGALVADLLCLWLPPGDLPGGVVDAVLDHLGRAVAAQIARARGHRLTEASVHRRTAARGKA
jgi:hypothetical protein